MNVWILLASGGVLIALISIPLAMRKVPRNWLYGLRTPATLEDEDVWYEANARCGRDLIGVGIVVALSAVVLHLAGLREQTYALSWAIVMTVGIVAVAVRGWTYASRLLREKRSGAR